jgi:hypothetical protein
LRQYSVWLADNPLFHDISSDDVQSYMQDELQLFELVFVSDCDSNVIIFLVEDGNNTPAMQQAGDDSILEERPSTPMEGQQFTESDGLMSHPNRSRKRFCLPKLWKKDIRKRLRQSGREYTNTRGVIIPEKCLPQFDCYCRLKCVTKVSNEVVSTIFQSFNAMCDNNRQSAFVAGHVESVPLLKQRSKLNKPSARTKSYKYYLTVPGVGKVQVCMHFFV